ncbi:DUF2500 domain-containing protein [Kineosporia babensis]|uniref:DUF2500 domain-containing protein n=1 Tax=Kineosporia babensis TaxID=499548 RepID=A0A9X1NI03_9ACTN|nr:DUF2500 domain-containing protein [Kineosporia babensis]MCD5314131.1 DUF2500 domain-containing protein [Kineosporia babensis]
MDVGSFSEFDDTFGFGMVAFFVFFFGILALVLAVFATIIVKGLLQWNRNNNSPLLTVPAVVVAKRRHNSRNENGSSTWYYLTFELQGHERVELPVHGHQWGTLVEGDRGRLTYQGTRYKGFDRTPQDR